MKNDINLNLYKVFYCVAVAKSFKQASVDLHVSQPAISKQIKNLEEILDVKLFYRYNKGIELTNEGEILLSQIEKVNFYLEATEKYLLSSKNLESGEIIIDCPSHITSFYLLKFVEKFRKDYPNVLIKLVNDSTANLLDFLEHHKLDFVIDSSPIEIVNKEMVLEELAEFETTLICNKTYKCDIKTINDLNGKELILPLPRSSVRKNFEKILFDNNVVIKNGLSVDTTDLIVLSVKKNMGIGYVVKESVIDDLENQLLREIKCNFEFPKLVVNLVYMKEYVSFPTSMFIKKYIKG